MKRKNKAYSEGQLNKDATPTYSAIRKMRAKISNAKDVKSFLFRLLILVAFLVLIFHGLFGLYAVSNEEMVPRVSPGDLILFFRYNDSYLADDVVIYQVSGENHVGRVVAKSGDSVDIADGGGLYINGNYEVENDIYFDTYAFEDFQDYPVALDEGEYFILADNRENAKDSRYYGVVSKEQIVGKVISLMRRGKL